MLATVSNLAADLFNDGKPEESLTVGLRALEMTRQVAGDDHTLTAEGNVANAYSALGRYAEAEQMLADVRTRANRLGHASLEVGALYNLACAAARQGHEKGALDRLREAIEQGLPAAVLHQLGEDPDLAPLRGKPAFDALVERAAKAK